RLEKASLLWRAAELRRSVGEDIDELAGRVLALDPEHSAAALWAVERWVDDGRFAEARPVLEMLLRKTGGCGWRALLARAAEGLGDHTAAADHWAAAGAGATAALGRARALAALGDAGAEAHIKEVLERHELAPGDASELWRRLAALARVRG